MKKWFTIAFFAVSCQLVIHGQIVINEVCVDNEELLPDFELDYPDWIELYNLSDSDINLHSYYLSDKINDPFKWQFPEIILPARSFLVLFASGKNTVVGEEIHTSFKLDEGMEGCYLSVFSQPLLSAVEPHSLPSDLSYGCQPDGSATKVYFAEPSPGLSNDHSVPEFFDEPSPIQFSHHGGFYAENFDLELLSERTGIEIRYTLDGSPVNSTSTLYSGPITIENNITVANGLAFIPTSDTWQQPKSGVRCITVVRAAPFENGYQAGAEKSHSYLVGDNLQTLEDVHVVSLSVDPEDFFSDSIGIYVHGDATYGNFTARGMVSERRIYAEYFGSNGIALGAQTIGARIHGRSSRYAPQKSIRLHARNRYGQDTLAFTGLRPGVAHHEVILRAPESLFSTSLFTDELVQTIVVDMNLDLQRQIPAIVFLNGEYWGLHHIREHLGAEYLHSIYGIDEDNVDILDWDRELVVLEGDDQAYRELENFLLTNDFSDPVQFANLEERVDVHSFTDYMAAQLFFANEDFGVNNVRFWKEKSDTSKWRFFFFDADASMREHWQNRLEEFLQGNHDNDPVSLLFSSLLENEGYRNFFFATCVNYLSTTFSPQNLLDHIESFAEEHGPLVSEHIRRWNRPESFAEWQNARDNLRAFAIRRPPMMLETLNQYFENPFTVYPNPCDNQTTLHFFQLSENVQPAVEIRDQTGRLVPFSVTRSMQDFYLDLSTLETGMYILHVDMGKMNYSTRIIKTMP